MAASPSTSTCRSLVSSVWNAAAAVPTAISMASSTLPIRRSCAHARVTSSPDSARSFRGLFRARPCSVTGRCHGRLLQKSNSCGTRRAPIHVFQEILAGPERRRASQHFCNTAQTFRKEWETAFEPTMKTLPIAATTKFIMISVATVGSATFKLK